MAKHFYSIPEALVKRVESLDEAGWSLDVYKTKNHYRIFVKTPVGWTFEGSRERNHENDKLDEIAYTSALADVVGAAWKAFIAERRSVEIEKLLQKISAFTTTEADWIYHGDMDDYLDSETLGEAIEEWQRAIVRINETENFYK